MLISAARATGTALALAVALVAVVAAPAAAEDTVVCDPSGDTCVVVVTDPGDSGDSGTPGTPGGEGDSGGGSACLIPGTSTEVPCHDPLFGDFNNADGCYYALASPQPPKSDPVWKGHTDGAIWDATCLSPGGGSGGGWVWLADPPPGTAAAPPDPADVAARAAAELVLKGPAIRMAPKVGRMGLVGLPVWMWTTVSPSRWGPTSATASVRSVSVTATAHVVKVVWSMGDGRSVTCTRPGTPYTAARGNAASPDCGYRYATSSAGKTDGAYTVTATSTWRIDWVGGGESGQLTQTRSSTAAVRIGELQVLIS